MPGEAGASQGAGEAVEAEAGARICGENAPKWVATT